jgi:hypothetical protein
VVQVVGNAAGRHHRRDRWRALSAGGISDQATGTVKSDNVQF